MTHPHTPSCLAPLSWATAAPVGASSSAGLSPAVAEQLPSPSPTELSGREPESAGTEDAGGASLWDAALDEASFLTWRAQGKESRTCVWFVNQGS